MLGDKIKYRRNELGISQELLAEKLGISRQAVSKWESGQSNPSTSNLLELSEILKIDLSEFGHSGKNEETPEKNNDIYIEEKTKKPKKKLGFFLTIFFVILGILFFIAYTLIMTEVFNIDYKSMPWLILTIYMIVAVFCLPEVYNRTKGLEQLDYFLFSKVLLPILYAVSPIVLVISLIRENV